MVYTFGRIGDVMVFVETFAKGQKTATSKATRKRGGKAVRENEGDEGDEGGATGTRTDERARVRTWSASIEPLDINVVDIREWAKRGDRRTTFCLLALSSDSVEAGLDSL